MVGLGLSIFFPIMIFFIYFPTGAVASLFLNDDAKLVKAIETQLLLQNPMKINEDALTMTRFLETAGAVCDIVCDDVFKR